MDELTDVQYLGISEIYWQLQWDHVYDKDIPYLTQNLELWKAAELIYFATH